MGEHGAGLGHDALEPGQQRPEPGRQRRGDEHRTGRRIGAVVGDRSAARAAAGAGAATDLAVALRADRLAEIGQLERCRQRRAEVVVMARQQRRDDDGAFRDDALDVLERQMTDDSGSGRTPDAARRSPSFQAARPDSSCTQRTRNRSASRRIPLSLQRMQLEAVGMLSVIASSGRTGAGGHLRTGERQHGGAANEDLLVVEAVLARLGEHAQCDGCAGHPIAARVGEHADEDLVGVQGAQDGPAAVQQGDELSAGELVQRWNGFEVGVRPVEEVLGQAGQGGTQPSHPPCPT